MKEGIDIRSSIPFVCLCGPAYSELVSPSDLPAVSGTMQMERTRSKITSPAATKKPLIVKLTPNVIDFTEIAKAPIP